MACHRGDESRRLCRRLEGEAFVRPEKMARVVCCTQRRISGSLSKCYAGRGNFERLLIVHRDSSFNRAGKMDFMVWEKVREGNE